MQSNVPPVSASIRGRWLALAGRSAWAVSACVMLAWGITAGDLTDREAFACKEASRWLTVFQETLVARVPEPLRSFLPMAPDVSWHVLVTGFSMRLASLLGVLATALWVYRWALRDLGPMAAGLAGTTWVLSIPAILASRCAGTDALWALFVLAATWNLRSAARDHVQWRGILGGIGCLACAGALTANAMVQRHQTWVHSPLVAASLALLTTFPWAAGVIPCVRFAVWQAFTPPARACLAASAGTAAMALALALVCPALWLGCALVLTAAASLALGASWQSWLLGEMERKSRRVQARLAKVLALGTPAAVSVLAAIRLLTVYPYLERTAAIGVAGLAGLALAGLAIRFRAPRAGIAMACVMVIALKLGYVHIHLPERDQYHSHRPYASAVARHLPPGASLHCDLPLSEAYRYYLGVPVEPLGRYDASSDGTQPRYALMPEHPLANTGERWEVVARLEGRAETRLLLARHEREERRPKTRLTRGGVIR